MAVAPLVNRNHPVALSREATKHTIPQSSIRRKTVNEQPRSRCLIALVIDNGKLDARREHYRSTYGIRWRQIIAFHRVNVPMNRPRCRTVGFTAYKTSMRVNAGVIS